MHSGVLSNLQQVIKGQCAYCGRSIEFILGEQIDEKRYLLQHKIGCSHCKAVLRTALRDQCGRYWGRKKVRSD
jgi:hypothetical protein